MAQDVQSILKELDAGYNPQRQLINDQIAQLQPQADQQIQGLNQTKDAAYRDISRSAADRGMYFSSIPSQDQADYVQKTYVPAVANVQKAVTDQKTSLLGALNNVNMDQYNKAYTVRQSQIDNEEKQREFDQQLAAQRAAAAQSAASSNAGAAGLAGLFGAGSAVNPAGQQSDPNAIMKQAAANDVISVLKNNNVGQLTRYYQSVSQSAKNGNQKDALKLQAMQALAPGLFKGGALNTAYLTNAAKQGIKLF